MERRSTAEIRRQIEESARAEREDQEWQRQQWEAQAQIAAQQCEAEYQTARLREWKTKPIDAWRQIIAENQRKIAEAERMLRESEANVLKADDALKQAQRSFDDHQRRKPYRR